MSRKKDSKSFQHEIENQVNILLIFRQPVHKLNFFTVNMGRILKYLEDLILQLYIFELSQVHEQSLILLKLSGCCNFMRSNVNVCFRRLLKFLCRVLFVLRLLPSPSKFALPYH